MILANHGLADVAYNARVQLDEDYDNYAPSSSGVAARHATVSVMVKAMQVMAVPLRPDNTAD